MGKLQLTYRDFLIKAKNHSNYPPLNLKDIAQLLSPGYLNYNLWLTTIYVIDYTNFKYLYIAPISGTMFGYSNSYLLNAGPEFILNKIHKDDFEIINKCIFPINMDYLFKNKTQNISDTLFTTTYRLKNKKGFYQEVCQSSRFVCSSQDNIPLVAIGSIIDITPFKSDHRVTHIIDNTNAQTPSATSRVLLRHYHPEDQQTNLSKREIDVLKWVCDGCSSKLIANKLNLSIHTVNNHRKNMLQKTKCKNISELLNHSLKNGVL